MCGSLNGEGIWEFRAGGQVDSSPVVSGEVVFIGCDDGMLYGLALADGAELWSYELGQEIKGSPAVADDFSSSRLMMEACTLSFSRVSVGCVTVKGSDRSELRSAGRENASSGLVGLRVDLQGLISRV